jgi:hypothetical protein
MTRRGKSGIHSDLRAIQFHSGTHRAALPQIAEKSRIGTPETGLMGLSL